MKLITDSSPQKLRGGYYTPEILADFILSWAFEDGPKGKVLEPSCGDGAFLNSLLKKEDMFDFCFAIELIEEEANKARNLVSENNRIKVKNADFFDELKNNLNNEKFNLIIGNPPYIRYQYLTPEQREIQANILTSNGMKSNKLINAWVSFLVASVQLLDENGKLGMVIPAELLQVAYAEDLRLFLEKNLSKITVITFEELVFPEVQQEVVLLLGEKGTTNETGNKIRLIELIDDTKSYNEVREIAVDYKSVDIKKDKWTKYFLSNPEIQQVIQIKNDPKFMKLKDIADVDIGITTGNNKFFSATKDIVEEYELQNVVLPLIGRSAHAKGIFFTEEDWLENVDKGLPAQLLYFPNTSCEDFSKGEKAYIEYGIENEHNKGYKLGIRKYWYHIPSVYSPDAFLLRRNDTFPKFVLNQIDAVSTDTMHRVRFFEWIDKRKGLLAYYNSITFAFTEMEGRSYGGGVLEVLPGEAENIMIPNINNLDNDTTERLLHLIDETIRNNGNVDEMLDIIDKTVLIDFLGIDEEMVYNFRGIWKKLMNRRRKRKTAKGKENNT